MDSLKLRKVGDMMMVAIPADVLDRYNLKEGDRLDLESGVESFTLRPASTETIRNSASRIMERHSEVLKRLAQ